MSDERVTGRLGRLHQHITDAFNLDELRNLCLYLDIQDDHLSGDTVPSKARELLLFMERRERLGALLEGLRQMRPHLDWHAIYPIETPEGVPPYRGLQPYREADSHLFFGREEQVEKIVAHLRQNRLLVLAGASGSGKSSLIRAGVIPALRQGAVSVNEQSSAGWPIHIIEPGGEPLKALAVTFTRDMESVSAAATLLKEMAADPQTLDLFLYRRLADNPDGRFLLVVDQFETLFTQCGDPEERSCFVENLVRAVGEGPDGRLSLILVLRADFYSQAIQLGPLQALLESNQLIVGAMNGESLRQAIEGPAEAGGWSFQPGLVETIMQDLGAAFGRMPEPGALPLLSLALHETWLRRSGRTLTLPGYQAVGGVQGVITNIAGALYGALTAEQQELARNIFLELVEVDPDIPTTRRRVPLEALAADEPSRQVLDLFAAKRLLTISQNSVEVAHEALIREWPVVQGWLADNREWIQLRRRLTDAAELWAAHQQDSALLYRGSILAHALAQTEQRPVRTAQQLSTLERRFLEESGRAAAAEKEQEESRRRVRSTLFGLLAGGLGFSLAYLVTYAAQTGAQSLLLYLAVLRVLPGALAGLTFASSFNAPQAAVEGSAHSQTLYNGLVGALSLGLALFFHTVLRQQAPAAWLLAAVQGAVWGFTSGAGISIVLSARRPLWQTGPLLAAAGSAVLAAAEMAGNAFQAAAVGAVLVAGALVPLSLLAAVWFGRRER